MKSKIKSTTVYTNRRKYLINFFEDNKKIFEERKDLYNKIHDVFKKLN